MKINALVAVYVLLLVGSSNICIKWWEREAEVSFPFEYYPLPSKGDVVDCVDREGNVVVKVQY